MRRHLFHRILLGSLLAMVLNLHAVAAQSHFESLTIEHGLSQGMIFAILQTRDGFLWVATKDGLNRYDGYNFKVYSNNPFDRFSLAENAATTLLEDSRGLLWIGTVSKGLDVYDRRTGLFHHIPRLQGMDMIEARDGSLWMLQDKKEVIRLTIPADWQQKLPDQADLSAFVTTTRIPIEGYEQENLFNLWLKEDGDIRMFSEVQMYDIDIKRGLGRALSKTGSRKLTGGAYAQGGMNWIVDDSCSYYVGKNGEMHRSDTDAFFSKYPLNMQDDGQGGIWLLFGKNLWKLNAGKPIDVSKPDWGMDRTLTCVYTDRNGNIWVGTAGYGLRKINPRRQMFHTGGTGESMWRVWCSPTGQYYWRDVSRIFRYDPVLGQTSRTIPFPEIRTERRLDLVFDSTGAFWMLGAGKNDNNNKGFLFRHNPEGKLLQTLSFSLNIYDYPVLKTGRDGALWMTGAQCQLVRFDPQTSRFDYFDYAHLFGEKSRSVLAFALVEDARGVWWIGTQQGLVRATSGAQGLTFQLFQADPDNPKGLNNNSIACLLPDPSHPGDILWIGTKGGGINRLNVHSGQVEHLTTAEGLPDMVVYGILPGNENPASGPVSLWCSTNRGLARIAPLQTTPVTYAITTFTAAKGLQDNEFNTQSYYKAANGELLFGGVNGLNRFFPEAVRSDTTRSPVFIVGVEINHEKVNYTGPKGLMTTPLDDLRELHLSYDQNNLSFEFAVLDFTDPARNRYRYRLVGLDADWVETGGVHFAHFTHLAPGHYEFRVQGSNGEGPWQDLEHPVLIEVAPPWYRSSLAYLCYLALLVWAGWQVYRFQIRRVKEREQLAFEQRETERVKAMEQVKTNFFSNITHEFRTPLTLIIEPLRQLQGELHVPRQLEKVRLAEQNSHKLLGLVNQLLDMAKLESGGMTLDLRRGDVVATTRNVFETFLPLAEKRGIQLAWVRVEMPPLEFDAGKVEVILNNLLSNALKFTPPGGKVKVELKMEHLQPADPSSTLHPPWSLQVSDTGPGIPPDSLDKIFDRFYQVDGSHTRTGEGTGIGLALSKELAELMGGGIRVESEPNKGSTFTLWLPASSAAPFPKMEEGARTNASHASPATKVKRVTGGEAIVLVVEDHVDLRHFIKDALADHCQVIEASDGEEGVRKAIELLPDLVISDVMMPRKDGYSLCDELKNHELTAHIPIILLTAKAGVEDKIKGLRTGADDYLTKPFNTIELIARLENLIETRRRLRERFWQQIALPNGLQVDIARTSEDPLPSPKDHEFLRKFTLLIEQHLSDETLGVEDFADKMHISRMQLHRKMKSITDQNPTDFIRDYRLAQAYSLLKNGEGNVFEVSIATGFGNEKYFSRVFKEKYGISPGKLKQ